MLVLRLVPAEAEERNSLSHLWTERFNTFLLLHPMDPETLTVIRSRVHGVILLVDAPVKEGITQTNNTNHFRFLYDKSSQLVS